MGSKSKKGGVLNIKLVSELGTGYYYVIKKRRNQVGKMSFRKYDAYARKHCIFHEKKLEYKAS